MKTAENLCLGFGCRGGGKEFCKGLSLFIFPSLSKSLINDEIKKGEQKCSPSKLIFCNYPHTFSKCAW